MCPQARKERIGGIGSPGAPDEALTDLESCRIDLESLDNLHAADAGPDEFNYRDVLRQWPLYQGRAAAGFMEELRELAATTAGRSIPIGANRPKTRCPTGQRCSTGSSFRG